MDARQRVERERGFEALTGTFAKVIAEWKQLGVPADSVREILRTFRVVPTITAHPTEAKRVTVLEKLRGIYAMLVALDAKLVTPRERALLGEELRTELDLLWMTGELKLEKPTVAQEVAWALHFFDTTLFSLVWLLHDSLALALAESYPGEHFDLPNFIQFGSWVGGDRDGNPNVTNEVTRAAVHEYRAKCLHRYQRRMAELSRALSISERSANFSPAFRKALEHALEQRRWRAARGAQSGRAVPPVAERRAAAARGDGGREPAQAWRRGAHIAAVRDGGRSDRGSQDAREGAHRRGVRCDRACDGGAGATRGGGVPVFDRAARSAAGIGRVQRGGGGAACGARRGRGRIVGARCAHAAAARGESRG